MWVSTSTALTNAPIRLGLTVIRWSARQRPVGIANPRSPRQRVARCAAGHETRCGAAHVAGGRGSPAGRETGERDRRPGLGVAGRGGRRHLHRRGGDVGQVLRDGRRHRDGDGGVREGEHGCPRLGRARAAARRDGHRDRRVPADGGAGGAAAPAAGVTHRQGPVGCCPARRGRGGADSTDQAGRCGRRVRPRCPPPKPCGKPTWPMWRCGRSPPRRPSDRTIPTRRSQASLQPPPRSGSTPGCSRVRRVHRPTSGAGRPGTRRRAATRFSRRDRAAAGPVGTPAADSADNREDLRAALATLDRYGDARAADPGSGSG